MGPLSKLTAAGCCQSQVRGGTAEISPAVATEASIQCKPVLMINKKPERYLSLPARIVDIAEAAGHCPSFFVFVTVQPLATSSQTATQRH